MEYHPIRRDGDVESRVSLQLLLRPGHLIDDYLSGKRQTSYPPVKMLLMVAVGIDIIRNLLGIPPNGASSVSDADVNSLRVYLSGLRKHLAAIGSKAEILSKRNFGYSLSWE